MKKLIILTVALVASLSGFSQTKAGKIDNTKHSILYSCPERSTKVITDLGKCPFCGMNLNLSPKEQIKTQVTKAYSCPLFANVTADKAGRKLNISPKEEMKIRVVGVIGSPNYSPEKEVAIHQN